MKDLNKNIALDRIRFVGEGSAVHCPQKALQVMKKINVGIDISKEKLNLCYQMDLRTIREDEIKNDVKSIKR